jgi:hypothetical protein
VAIAPQDLSQGSAIRKVASQICHRSASPESIAQVAGERGRVVRRGERDQRFDVVGHVVVDDRGLGERGTAVHDPVPDRGETGVFDAVHDLLPGASMVRRVATGLADPFDHASAGVPLPTPIPKPAT